MIILQPITADESARVINLQPITAEESAGVINLQPITAEESAGVINLQPIIAEESDHVIILQPITADESAHRSLYSSAQHFNAGPALKQHYVNVFCLPVYTDLHVMKHTANQSKVGSSNYQTAKFS